MFDFIADMPLVELFSKFMIASTLLMGAVWLAEKVRLINTPDLAELAWKLAIAGSFLALLPVGNWLSGPITIEHKGAAQIVQKLEHDRPLATIAANRDAHMRAVPDNDIPTHGANHTTVDGPDAPAMASPATWVEATTKSATPRETSAQHNTLAHEVIGTEPFMPEADSEETISTSLLAGVADLTTKQITALLWGLVALLATGALGLAYRLAVRDLGSRTRVDGEHKANRTLRALCAQVDIRHVPYLSRSNDIKSPICLPRREICLPDWAFDDLPDAELKSLLAHELGHMVRRDPLMLMTLQMVSRLFFFQPMFILARKRLTDIAELAADEWAAKQLADARAVATALFTCATRIQENRQIQWGLAMAGNKSMLKTRVERLIGAERLPFKNAGIAAKAGLTAGMVVLTLGLPGIQFAEAMTAENDLSGNWSIETAHRDAEREAKQHLMQERLAAKRARKQAEALIHEAEREAAFTGEAEHDIDRIAENLLAHETGMSGEKLRAIGISKVQGTLDLKGDTFSYTSEDGNQRAHSDGNRRSVSITSHDNGKMSGNMVWIDDDRVFKAEWDGEFELSDDEQSVKSITRGGELELETKGDGPRRRIRFEEKSGQIKTTYWRNGDKTALDRDGEEWLAKTLLTLIRETGLNADKRVARLLKKDGPKAVLQEMDTIESDYVTRIYSTHLVGQANLSEKEAMQLIDRLVRLESDYEMRLALTTLMVEEKLSVKVMPKILKAAENIESDYELRLLLSPYLDKFGVNKKTMKTLISLARRMDSDYEVRLLLSPYFSKTDLDNDMLADLLDVASQIDSDYEMRLLLTSAVHGKKLSTKNIEKLARIASEQLDSDYETRLFMSSFVGQIAQSSDATEILIDKTRHIDSDYERRLTISMLVSHGKMTEKAWLSAFDATISIDSDYEKAQILSQMGHSFPKDNEKIARAYARAVESIDSDYERERVAMAKPVRRPAREPRPVPLPAPEKAVEPTGI